MSRNKALTALQKTYDDTYLSCSTAVYHETQGNEHESMRHWKGALDQIYDYNANKALPSYVPRTDTEKALIDALKSLELQCKERIDLLEALRISRADEQVTTPASNASNRREPEHRQFGPASPGLGNGTIPAVTYAELSRPALPPRPSTVERTASEVAIVGGDLPGEDQVVVGSPLPGLLSPESSGKHDKDKRAESPGKHTMRTTLRAKSGEKSARPTRKTQRAGEGPSKAATLAWSSLASRDKSAKESQPESPSLSRVSSPRKSTESPRRAGSSNLQWDSHSRRLVKPRSTEPRFPHLSDDASRSPQLSVSAASSALNSSANIDTQHSALSTASRRTRSHDRSVTSKSGTRAEMSSQDRNESMSDTSKPTDSTEPTTKPDPLSRRKPVPRRKPAALQGFSYNSDVPKASRSSSSSDGGNDRSRQSNGCGDGTSRSIAQRKDSQEERPSTASSEEKESAETAAWKKKKAAVMKNLPAGVDEAAAKQILNDIIVEGDEVRWNDIAGLDIAKAALREAVVYPFLRPDLFMGLREPTRGMLLFGPPGTGKTMLARAVATESKSTFFSISASSLTSKYLGESEKLVRALFGLARALSPSIIFVDEIDSLLSQRSGSGEHEATRRIKTEFLIQWSDLQRAAAGRETTDKDKERGDANRVLVLAATNLPWAIDEAARRRFVRRQYIPLPEPTTRETQLRTLLGQQKHSLTDSEIIELVRLTDGFSGSDMTALAKDAAMGPLRSLGEALLHMTMEDIRPIMLVDFEASLVNIRPSVGKAGLKEYEDWAKEFGERGG